MKREVLLMLISLLPSVGIAQTKPSDSSEPPPRHLERVVYDLQRERLILFGGGEFVNEEQVAPEYVSEWGGSQWQFIDAKGPAGRNGPQLVYDTNKKINWLIGGTSRNKPGSRFFSDVWTWDGRLWTLADTLCPIQTVSAAYDPDANRILVYGDVVKNGTTTFELWEFKTGTWNKLSTDGPNVYAINIVYDEKRKSLIIVDWEKDNCVSWEWINNQWSKKINEKAGPSNRVGYSLSYSKKDEAVYLLGGSSLNPFQPLADFWKWDGQKWTKIEATIKPSARSSATLTTTNNSLLLYGGSYKDGAAIGLTNELWEWKKGKWKLLNNASAQGPTRKIDSLRQCIGRTPENVAVLMNYSVALKNAGSFEDAEANYKKLLTLQPNNTNAMFDLITVLIARDKPDESESYFSKIINSGSLTAANYAGLGMLRYNMAKYKEGVTLYEKAVELGVNDRGLSVFNLACGYIKLNEKDKAFATLEKAIGGYLSRHRLVNDPKLEPLRSDPRYRLLLEKVK